MSTTTATFTIEQILLDRQFVHDAVSTEAKKQMCAKYGITSNKTKEIEKAILAIGLELHKQNTTFTVTEDVRVFDLYWNRPESAQKIREAFADESDSFIRFYTERLRKLYEQNHLRARWTLRPISYLTQILNERSKDNTERDALALALDVQMKDFHDRFIKAHLDYANWKFDHMFQKYAEIKSTRDIILKLNISDQKEVERLHKMISTFRVESRDFDKDYYIERVRRDFEAEYLRCLLMIADRVLTAKMNTKQISVQNVSSSDAKAFDIYVKDDQRTMHARSIWCAEYSEIVTPHWRFIITNA